MLPFLVHETFTFYLNGVLNCKCPAPGPKVNRLEGDMVHILIIIIYLFTAIGLTPGGSGYFTCKQNMKSVTTKFKSGVLHEKHVVATWNVGNRLSVCL